MRRCRRLVRRTGVYLPGRVAVRGQRRLGTLFRLLLLRRGAGRCPLRLRATRTDTLNVAGAAARRSRRRSWPASWRWWNQHAGEGRAIPIRASTRWPPREYGATGNAACNSSLGTGVDSSCIFNDVTLGDMDVNCTGTVNCYRVGGGSNHGVLSTRPPRTARRTGRARDGTIPPGSVPSMPSTSSTAGCRPPRRRPWVRASIHRRPVHR